MAPLSTNLINDRTAEIELARAVAPPTVSAAAEVLLLKPHGYEIGAEGVNLLCLHGPTGLV